VGVLGHDCNNTRGAFRDIARA